MKVSLSKLIPTRLDPVGNRPVCHLPINVNLSPCQNIPVPFFFLSLSFLETLPQFPHLQRKKYFSSSDPIAGNIRYFCWHDTCRVCLLGARSSLSHNSVPDTSNLIPNRNQRHGRGAALSLKVLKLVTPAAVKFRRINKQRNKNYNDRRLKPSRC